MIVLKSGVEGPFNTGVWVALDTETDQSIKLHGKHASLLSLLLTGYELRSDVDILSLFTVGSLEAGRAVAKVAEDNG